MPPENAISDVTSVPESPLFCPGPAFATIIQDRHCSKATLDLLCNMRDLTRVFVTNDSVDTQFDLDVCNAGCMQPFSRSDAMRTIYMRVALLPSAYTPGLPTTNDWVYEACRITALIYTAAIVKCIPFSIAADPEQNPIFGEMKASANARNSGDILNTPLTEVLYEVLERTDTGNCWNDMAGVFYWVCCVGAAAARTPVTINMTQQPRFRSEAYSIWVRRCLVMLSFRTLVILIFKHTFPTIKAQKQLLKVQALIRRDTTKQPGA